MEIVSSTSTVAGPTDALVKFCLLWSAIHRSKPPEVCNNVLNMENLQNTHLDNVFFNQKRLNFQNHAIDDILDPHSSDDMENPFQFHFKHSSRSLSVIG